MRLSSSGFTHLKQEGEKRCVDSELWHACAGPLVSLPAVGSPVVYFPQGHSEQVAASTNMEVDAHMPNYPSLPPQLLCQLHDVAMHADVETDEVYAQMTLQPLSPQEQKDAYLPVELGAPSKQPTNYFCKTLTASDTSTHGGFSVPRRAAEKVFPPLDFSQQPPAQELIARDLHGNEWKFRHIFRGQPKRHLLTTGWSVFVSAKRLVAGDSVLFIWNEKNQLLLGIRRANRHQAVTPSSVLSSDSMHIGLLAAAAHAAATNSRFTIFYNPRASPSEFVVPLAKYVKAVYHTRVSVGMRFRMLFETEESSVRRYMGTITGISDLDPIRWPNSNWRSVKVGWDESTSGERQPRISLWEIEPLTTFPMYPSPFPLGLKRPWATGLPSLHGGKENSLGINSPLMWLRGDGGDRRYESLNFQGIGVTPWMPPRVDAALVGPDMHQAVGASAPQQIRTMDFSKQALPSLLQFQQSQDVPRSVLMQRQILQHSHPQHAFLQSVQEDQPQPQSQDQIHLLQQQLQEHHQCNGLQQLSCPQMLNDVSALSRLVVAPQSQSPSIQTISSLCQVKSIPDSNRNHVTASGVPPLQSLLGSFSQDETSNLPKLPRTNQLIPSASWLPMRAASESLLPLEAHQSVLPPVEQLGSQQVNISQYSTSLPPFPGGECSVDQGSVDPHNRLLFGVNINSSSLSMENSMPNLRPIGSESDSIAMAFTAADFPSATGNGNDFILDSSITTSSCLDESVFLQSLDNGGQVSPANATFVKVYKSGSFGRSLDITRFSSYHELRSELAQMFGLQGQLDAPMRSGWQLVFVDRENDVLLLGDDPWQEFVNNVWCIKILSPQEVQEMGKLGLELLNSAQRLSSGSYDNLVNQHDSKSLSSGITSMGSLDYVNQHDSRSSSTGITSVGSLDN